MPRPLTSIDPGPTVRRWGWFLWLAWAVIGTGLLGEDRGGGGFALGIVLSAPFWALWLLWPLYRAWSLWMRWRGHSGGQEWQGHHEEFEGRPVRVLHDGAGVWFAADDAFDVLELDDGQRAAGRRFAVEHRGSGLLAFSAESLAAWLEPHAPPAALRFREWAVARAREFSRRDERPGL